jgi:NADH-quinone oxidoreductase subunit A
MGFQFGAILAFAVVSVGFGVALLSLFGLFRPHFPETDKSSIYECGERPIGRAWFNFNPRFYLVALVFVIFEVEIALTFPVVVVYKKWIARGASFGWIAFSELFLFTAILAVGLAWVWAHGDLRWMKRLGQAPAAEEPAPPPSAKNRAA